MRHKIQFVLDIIINFSSTDFKYNSRITKSLEVTVKQVHFTQ